MLDICFFQNSATGNEIDRGSTRLSGDFYKSTLGRLPYKGYFKHLTSLHWGCHTCINNFFYFGLACPRKAMSLFLISIQNKVDFSRSKEVNYRDSDIKIKRGKLSRF